VLLVAAVPLSLVWIPLGNVPGAGNVTASDVGLIALWALTAWALMVHGFVGVDVRAFGLALLAVLVGVLAALGSELSTLRGRGLLEFFHFMKRFGLASILPLAAVLFGARAMVGWTRAVTLVALVALAVVTVFPELQAYLPRPDGWNLDELDDRATGLVTNPNDLAYAAVGLVILHGAFVPSRASAVDWALLGAALVAFATSVIAAASRSGLLGAAGALSFILLSPRIRAPARAALAAFALVVVVAGLLWSSRFVERVTQAYKQGLSEGNVSSRLDAQWVAMKASLDYPLGVGFTGFAETSTSMGSTLARQSTDSVYCETLLGAGFLGLVALLGLFGVVWKHVARHAAPGDPRAITLKSGLFAFLLFGTASVIPISVFLSPLFFSFAAAAAYPGPDEE
jgi:O-antigen ligase